MTMCPMCAHENADGDELCAACGWPLGRAPVAYPTALPAGTTLQEGRYEIRAPLGRGGFAYVYEAWDRRLNGVVAIKELFPGDDRLCVRAPGSRRVLPGPLGADFAASVERFLHEGQLLLPLRHSGVVGVLDCFEENGTGYVVMQRVQGESLGARVAREGALPVAEVERIGSGIAEALAYLHARTPPILHRDLTPENVMLEPGGQPVLIDFGLAREQIERPGSRSVAFTDGYAPPEQYSRTAARGPFSDIYSLGAVLYYMVAGTPPPHALDRVQGAPLAMAGTVPQSVRETIQAATHLDPRERLSDAGEIPARLRGEPRARTGRKRRTKRGTTDSAQETLQSSSQPAPEPSSVGPDLETQRQLRWLEFERSLQELGSFKHYCASAYRYDEELLAILSRFDQPECYPPVYRLLKTTDAERAVLFEARKRAISDKRFAAAVDEVEKLMNHKRIERLTNEFFSRGMRHFRRYYLHLLVLIGLSGMLYLFVSYLWSGLQSHLADSQEFAKRMLSPGSGPIIAPSGDVPIYKVALYAFTFALPVLVLLTIGSITSKSVREIISELESTVYFLVLFCVAVFVVMIMFAAL